MNRTNQKLLEDLILKLDSEDNLAPATLFAYRFEVSKFLQFVDKDALDVTTRDFRTYLYHLKDSGISPATRRRSIVLNRRFFAFLVSEGYAQVNPIQGVSYPKMRLKEVESLTREEVYRFFNTIQDLQDRAIFTTLYQSGCRVGELINLDVGAVDPSGKLIVDGKTGVRECYIGDEGLEIYNLWLKERSKRHVSSKDKNALFLCRSGARIYERFVLRRAKSYAKKAGITRINVTVNTFRKTFTTHLLEQGVSELYIAELLGQQGTTTLKRHYAEIRKKALYRVYTENKGALSLSLSGRDKVISSIEDYRRKMDGRFQVTTYRK